MIKRFFKGIASIADILIVLALIVIIPYALSFFLNNGDYGSFYTEEMENAKNYKVSNIFEDKGVSTDANVEFTESDLEMILAELKQEYGEDMLYKTTDVVLDKKDYQNRHYSELTIVTARKESNDDSAYWHKYRKYLSENKEYQVGEVVLYLSARSNTVKKSDLENN